MCNSVNISSFGVQRPRRKKAHTEKHTRRGARMLSSTAAASRSAMHTKTWTDKEREILIDEVRQKPELYNNTHQEFKNKERRAQAFERIAEVISSMPESTPVDGRS